MAKETFEVTLSDEQLEAAKAAAARRGVNLGPSGSLHRDGVTINYTASKTDAGNVVAVEVLYRPFYVPAEEVQSLIENFLTNPPAAEDPATPAEPPVQQPPPEQPPVESIESESHSRRSNRR